MITSWADEEEKANAKYDAIRGKSKQNTGSGNNNNRDQGGHNNNYWGPNRKCKPDNTFAAIQRPAKDNSKKTSGGFKDLLKETCPWTWKATTPPSSATNFGEHSRTLQTHELLTTRKARKKLTRATMTSKNLTRR
jgi:hypothetical protein